MSDVANLDTAFKDFPEPIANKLRDAWRAAWEEGPDEYRLLDRAIALHAGAILKVLGK